MEIIFGLLCIVVLMNNRINRHTYTGILEGIGVCIGVPAKRGQTQNTTVGKPKKAVNCYLWSAAIRFRVGGGKVGGAESTQLCIAMNMVAKV